MASKRKAKAKAGATRKKATRKQATRSAAKQASKPATTRKPTVRKKATRSAAARQSARRARASGPPPMFQKVAFTMFSVVDAGRARAFYEDVLGLTRGLASPDGTWTEYDLPGGGCLALFRHPDPGSARAPGGASVAFEVADLDALNQRLGAAGVVYQGDMVHGPRCRMSNILDSEGNAIILHQLTRA